MNSETEKRWDELGLSPESLNLIEKAGYRAPSPVQAATIPISLTGRDVIAGAQTGTGKTASFVLPMMERFAGRQGTFGLILAPTREIAQQIQATLEIFGTPRGIRSIVLIGGIDIKLDQKALDTYPQVIVATPGRLCDHLDRGNIWLDYIEMVVLDEADRMLDMGFSDQLTRIMSEVPEKRQTLLFSATIGPTIEHLSRKILKDPERVSIGRPLSAAGSVEQKLIWMREESKNRMLSRVLREEPGTVIVFTRSKDGASRVWRSLHSAGNYDVTYIHSDRLQAHREQALAEFKSGKYRVLVATDVAGRGIHVDAVAHVVNYDLPMEPEDYVHRIGRTGRQDASGKATSFCTPRDRSLMRRIEKLLGKTLPAEYMDGLSESGEGDDAGGSRGGREGGRGGDRGGRGSRGGRGGSNGASGGGRESDGDGKGGERTSGRSTQAKSGAQTALAGTEAPAPRPTPSAPGSGAKSPIAPRAPGSPIPGPATQSQPVRAMDSLPPFDNSEDGGIDGADEGQDAATDGAPGEGGDRKKRRRRKRRGGGTPGTPSAAGSSTPSTPS